jgi:hypothetical protein
MKHKLLPIFAALSGGFSLAPIGDAASTSKGSLGGLVIVGSADEQT